MARGQNREQLLQAGLDLLYRQGFNASGVQEIADAGGVPKGSFYNYFKSKEDFAKQVLGLYTETLSAHLERTLFQGAGSPLSRFRGLFEGWVNGHFTENNGCGCLAGNLSQELATQIPALRGTVDRAFDTLQSYYAACLRQARDAGEIDADADPEQLAAFVYNAWQGALVRAKAQGNTKALQHFLDVVFGKVLT